MTTFTGPPLDTEPGVGALTFGGFLDDLAAKYGDRPAIVASPRAGPRVEWTYSELRNQAWSVAKALTVGGVTRGTRVGILLPNRPEWVAAVWGAAIAGGVGVPFNTFLERPELEHVLRHSDATVLITQDEFLRHRYVDEVLELCPEARAAAPGEIFSASYPFLRRIVTLDGQPRGAVESWESFVAGGAYVPDAVVEGRIRETDPSEDGAIIYSSGTTSLPKGVLHRHRAPIRQSWRHAYREQFTPDDKVYCALPLFWTAGFAAVLGGTLGSGACLVLPTHFDALDCLRLIEEERVTIPQLGLNHHIEVQAELAKGPRDISSIRRDVHRLTGEDPPEGEHRPANMAAYGSSETFTSITGLPDDAEREERQTYGRLTAGAAMRILDTETGVPLGPGQEGEIILKGITVTRGYVKIPPEATFDEEGFIHTGDLGWIGEDGLLRFTGRRTNMIKTSGANVAPLEVEEALVAHPEIARAVVVGAPDPVADEIVVACVVLREGSVLTQDEARGWLRGRLSSFKIPRQVLFFADDDLPRTGSGEKFELPALKALVAKHLGIDA